MSIGGVLLRSKPSRVLPEPRAAGIALVDAVSVAVELDGHPIVRDVNLEARAGEVLALVGPNGAGKSTLLATLAGDRPPTSGSVVVDGRPVTSWSPVELAQRRAVLPQQVSVSSPFMVADIVRMGRAPWSRSERESLDDAVVAAALHDTEVSHLARRPFPSLSGGERARVALARVLAQQTQILLLDEPTASLDLHHQELVLERARARAGSGDAVITVLHDLSLAAAHADRVAILSEGRVVAEGPPGSVLTAHLLSEVYRHHVEVITHPRTGELLVVPSRAAP